MSIRVGMIVYGGFEHDARVRREASALAAAGYEVAVGILDGDEPPQAAVGNVQIVRAHPFRGRGVRLPGSRTRTGRSWSRRAAAAGWVAGYIVGLWSWRRELLRSMPRSGVWHGHDLFGLWAASSLQRRHGGRLVYDSHELFMEAGTAARLPGPARRLLAGLEGRLARRADAVITVNPSIAAELRQRYGVEPVVIWNVPEFATEPATGDALRAALGLEARRVVLYHGALSPGRGIEQLVEAADALPPDVAVVFLGDGPLAEELRDRSASAAGRGRIYLHRAVEIEELPGWVAGADVGVIAFQAINRNNYLATPNKLFDYLAGGVPVVVSDFPEMRRIVEGGDAGVCCDPADPASIARGICRLLEAVGPEAEDRRRRIADYAVRTFGWPAQRDALVAVYGRLDGRLPSS